MNDSESIKVMGDAVKAPAELARLRMEPFSSNRRLSAK
jgi:hypothetical protein